MRDINRRSRKWNFKRFIGDYIIAKDFGYLMRPCPWFGLFFVFRRPLAKSNIFQEWNAILKNKKANFFIFRFSERDSSANTAFGWKYLKSLLFSRKQHHCNTQAKAKTTKRHEHCTVRVRSKHENEKRKKTKPPLKHVFSS